MNTQTPREKICSVITDLFLTSKKNALELAKAINDKLLDISDIIRLIDKEMPEDAQYEMLSSWHPQDKLEELAFNTLWRELENMNQLYRYYYDCTKAKKR